MQLWKKNLPRMLFLFVRIPQPTISQQFNSLYASRSALLGLLHSILSKEQLEKHLRKYCRMTNESTFTNNQYMHEKENVSLYFIFSRAKYVS